MSEATTKDKAADSEKKAAKAKPSATVKETKEKVEKPKAAPKKEIPPVVVLHLKREQISVVEGFNPRINLNVHELSKSILANGIKEPLHGKKAGELENGLIVYELTDGHRRLAAWDLLGKKNIEIPFIPEPDNYTEMQRTMDLLLRNDSEPLNMLEEAEVFKRLCDTHKLSQAHAADRTGRSKMHVSNCMLLLTADDDTKAQIAKGLIAPSLVIEMLKKKDKEEVSKNVAEAVAKKEGKKVTKKDVLPKKSLPATSQDKFEAAQSRKENKPQPAKKEENTSLEKLDVLIDTIENAAEEKNRVAFLAIKATRDYLYGKIQAKDLAQYFFVQTEPVA
jgi:ParB/RepB/Spo0J family partition protein